MGVWGERTERERERGKEEENKNEKDQLSEFSIMKTAADKFL